jgi:hypothetical protein
MLSDFFKRVFVIVICTVGCVAVTTTIMSFAGVAPASYNPYMYFIIAMAVFGLFLSPKPISVTD